MSRCPAGQSVNKKGIGLLIVSEIWASVPRAEDAQTPLASPVDRADRPARQLWFPGLCVGLMEMILRASREWPSYLTQYPYGPT